MLHWNSTSHYFTSSLFSAFPIRAYFGDRKLKKNEISRIVPLIQVHGDTIVYVSSLEKNIEADGLITKTKSLTLAVKTADCVPIIFFDRLTNTIAISHQGWRGLLKELPNKMIRKLTELQSAPENIVAAIGPSINECCYRIDEKLFNSFSEILPEYKNAYVKKENTYYLNLQKLAYQELLSAGLRPEDIDHFPFCTMCDSARFHSYRSDRTPERMISAISML